MRIRIPIAVALAAVIAVSSFGINAASAAPAASIPAVHQGAANGSPLIEVTSRKRHRGNNAAAAAAFAGVAGALIGLAIQESQRDRYYRHGGYGYYDGGPHYYRGRHYYGSPGPYHPHRGLQPWETR
ncbi:hypothetical protein [Undibacter mobilis]|uniref:Transmembrane protein n=1 Tax=Undibacter mobilis TaxID=2292256 RepID=A0A371B7Z5_9BRAD|nr:hypothetical protein [Undibacter mobilis]RDV03708.1 hypothetical protein DXH78_03375 [Undibacter mobilis]